MQIRDRLMAAGASLAGLVNSANAAKYVNVSIEQGQKNFSAITYADKIVWALNLLNYAVYIVAIAVIAYAGILMLMGGVGRVQDELRAKAVLHQLDQKIIYPHYDFKHLTEKYFEIGMKLNDFSIQLVKY